MKLLGGVGAEGARAFVRAGLKAMTIRAAWQHSEEKDKGSIEVGKLADFTILSREATQGDPRTIQGIRVTETVKE